MSQFTGYIVSIDCRDVLGSYQGRISNVDPVSQAITLTDVYQQGMKFPSGETTISADDILNISIIDEAKEENHASESYSAKVKKPVAKRAGRSVSESLAYNHTRELTRKPVTESRLIPATLSEGNRTPNKKDKTRQQKWSDRDEACFGTPIDHLLEQDFDFEKNLALFNKKAVYQEIDASQRPDVVKQTDGRVPQYRHDENVIVSEPTVWRQIIVPSPDNVEYVTDDGLVIPSVTLELRQQLLASAERAGLSAERQTELMGRAATEVTLQLLGGAHRLNPHNSHQWPTVAAVCGSHRQGEVAVNAARQLASHGVKTVVFLLDPVNLTSRLAQEVALYRLTGHKLVTSVQVSDLPSVDLVILGGASHGTPPPAGYAAVARWASGRRAPVLALDPPALGSPLLHAKCSLVPALPLAHAANNGKIYLCNIALPMQVFQDLGIKYTSPFGPKFVIALHPNEPSQ